MRSLVVGAVLGALGLAAAGLGPVGAGAEGATSPALESDPVVLETSLDCPKGLTHADKPVVLLVHGTATTAAESWPSGLGVVLSGAGFDWCTVQLPSRALVDIQETAEHVVAAVRRIHGLTGRKVSMVGHSQGALQPRWAVRWWPEVRAVVDDLITIAGANRPLAWTKSAFCSGGSCAGPIWQFSDGATFLVALNKVPTPEGPSYTTIRSLTDNLIQPAMPPETAVATIDGAANFMVQDLCPGRPVEHVGLIFDAVALALVMDALTHDGPAESTRVGTAHCAEAYAAGIDPVVASAGIMSLYANAFPAVFAGPKVTAEPPLREFAR